MAKRKVAPDNKSKSRKKPQKRSGAGQFFHVVTATSVRYLILLVAVIALLYWQWSNIENAFTSITGLFGWGLIFIIGAIITLIVMIARRQAGSLLFQWNRWLGAVAFVLAVWGILAFAGLGGSFGDDIIAFRSPVFIWVLRVIALVIIGIILVAPGAFFRSLVKFFTWIGEQFKRRPAPVRPIRQGAQPSVNHVVHPRPPLEAKPPLPAEMERMIEPPETVIPKTALVTPSEKEAADPEIVQTPYRQNLRQVAQDVWKKYGQSPELVTVDGWRLPPIDILDITPEIQFSQADNMQRAKLIEEALASYGVEARVVQINAGPTVTQFGIEPGWDRKYKEIKERDRDGNIQVRMEEVSKTRVKVERITSLSNDISLALAAPIRIEAPVPGKSVIGIEVPNTTSDIVSLRGVVETTVFQKLLTKSRMALALGKGAGGEAVAADLTKMPHLLVAGATGSGKTVCLNTIICCLLMHNTPNDLRFIMVDPKRVEMTQYNSLPHMATPVIVDASKALTALRWLAQEMDERYQKLATAGARHIEGYNKNKAGEERLPYLVLVIDELADLMMAGFDEVESTLCRLAQLSRATGIHLVVATQRPSVDVVTGLIKANFPTRISFAVTSQVDSRTILDGAGAEKLLGRGDMLFMPTEASKPKRLQGCFLSDAEMERLVYFWGSQRKEEADKFKMEALVSPVPATGGYPRDPLLDTALELSRHGNISTSFLQRRLHIGYPRAARLMEQLEEEMAKESGEGQGEG